jgi:20S proteasome alpha/beta subunit
MARSAQDHQLARVENKVESVEVHFSTWLNQVVHIGYVFQFHEYSILTMQGYYGAATGKGRQAAKSELEKLELGEGNLTLEEGVMAAAKIIYIAHEDSKDKEFELEMTWVSSLSGPTKGRHEEVPKALREEAERLAKKSLEGDDDDEKKDDDKMEE